jgi:hypothetical protein
VAQPAAAERPGKHLIGQVEGPSLVTDPAQFPKQFREAPRLAELVKQGKLLPVVTPWTTTSINTPTRGSACGPTASAACAKRTAIADGEEIDEFWHSHRAR